MSAIITNDLRITNGDYFKDNVSDIPMYIYFGGSSPWEDEQNPPDSVDSTKGRISAMDDIIGLKRIFGSNIASVLPRYDWKNENVYDEYTDEANIIDDKNPETNEYYKFFVVTDEFNVYKCISNNNRSKSTVKPRNSPIVSFSTPDGYIWKYMYTIKAEDAFNYMTPNWIPCYTIYNNDRSQQWYVQNSAIHGTIEHIVVENGGVGHTSSNPPLVTISGNGSGATAVAQVNDFSGEVSKIIVTNFGENYTSASVQLSGGDGASATAKPVLSPINGHGYDARSELGSTYKVIRVEVNNDENGKIPIGIQYRKAGILVEPKSIETSTTIYVSDTKFCIVGDTLTGKTSGATGIVRSINSIKKKIYLEEVIGVFSVDEFISRSALSEEQQVLSIINEDNLPLTDLVVSGSDYKLLSGTPIYYSSREKITRGVNQIEAFLFIISF